jgi:hypothetical protein
MNKYAILLVLAVLVLLARPTSGQQHALTFQQCRADAAAWVPKNWRPGDPAKMLDNTQDSLGVSSSHNANIQEINLRWLEMEQCKEIDREPVSQFTLQTGLVYLGQPYTNAQAFYWLVITRRMKDFMDRSHLWEQFLQEDKQGKR